MASSSSSASSSSAAAAAATPEVSSPEAKARALECKEEGNAHHKAGEYNKAITSYTAGLKLDPENLALLSNRAAAKMMVGAFEGAIADCDTAIKAATGSHSSGVIKAYIRGATARIRMGQVSDALELLTRAHLHDPRHSGVVVARNAAVKLLSQLERAKEAVSDGRHAAAVKEIAAVRREVKKSMDLDLLEAEALVGMGKAEEALTIATDVMRTPEGRRSSKALTTRAKCLYLQGNLVHAQRHLEQVIKMEPDDREAGALLKTIRRLEACKAKGNDAFRSGDNEQAVAEYSAIIDLKPDSRSFLATVYANRAAARMRLGQWELASADCDACLGLNDQYLKGYLRRAECGQKIGSKEALEKALRDLNAAKDLAPDAATLRNLERDIPRLRQLIRVASKKDYYKILGVPRSATSAQIKKAYRKLTLKHHPDKVAHMGEQERKIAEAKSKDLNEAWDVLSDETKKSRYDAGVDPEHLDDDHVPAGGFSRGGGGGGGMDIPPEVLAAMFGAMGGGMGGMGGMGGGRSRARRRGGGMPAGMHFSFG